MINFPTDITFKYNWRKYQKRVLDELNEHLADNHLHIIAPPGSGKTILGLEVAIRLNKPTLIFAPTLSIRNQWIQRFCDLFLQVEKRPDWISRDIKNPKFLTVATYQSLHAACTGVSINEELEEEDEGEIKIEGRTKTKEIIELLKAQNIGTIVVDEAHHLKNAWWQSLTEVKAALNATVVGLTATPPYDVSYAEWQRYIELNGPVDAEISVPELVVEGDLCPHQDYVYFSRPTKEEACRIETYRERIQTLFDDIKKDKALIEALEKHPIFSTPKEQLDWIYNNLEYYSATLVFLKAAGKEITQGHLEIIGDKNFLVPELSFEWIEILLTFYLYLDQESFGKYKDHQEKLINKLKRNGAMERRSVNFRYNRKINAFLGSSISKLKSINQIVDFERSQLGKDLRMVILTDYIRKEYLVNGPKNELELDKIGVMPIFEKLRRTNKKQLKIGVLTGSLTIIPVSALSNFKSIAATYGVEKIAATALSFDSEFLEVSINSKLKHDIVHIITQIFEGGHIEVLIGTKSLLGEGWDAPSINALVLASFVGSYVLSNQMRGRAIRADRQNLEKTGNIWHLVCIDPKTADGGDDLQLLQRRFKAFVGVSFHDEDSIENGIGRLNLRARISTVSDVSKVNDTMLNASAERSKLKEMWQKALESGDTLIEEIKVPFPDNRNYKEVKSFYYNRTIKYLLGALGSGLISYALEVLQVFGRGARHIRSKEDVQIWFLGAGAVGVLLFGRLAFKTFRAYVKYRDISKDIHNVGESLLVSLVKVGAIHTSLEELKVDSAIDKSGAIYCHLEGGTTYEKSIFIKSLQEVVGPVESPRYLMVRKSFFLNLLAQKDYHSVPDIIGRKKQHAEYFKKQWGKFVGDCELIYTRTIEGRKLLLKSRIQSLASEFQGKTERINKWR